MIIRSILDFIASQSSARLVGEGTYPLKLIPQKHFDLIDCIWTISKESLDLEFLDEQAHINAKNSDLLLSKP